MQRKWLYVATFMLSLGGLVFGATSFASADAASVSDAYFRCPPGEGECDPHTQEYCLPLKRDEGSGCVGCTCLTTSQLCCL